MNYILYSYVIQYKLCVHVKFTRNKQWPWAGGTRTVDATTFNSDQTRYESWKRYTCHLTKIAPISVICKWASTYFWRVYTFYVVHINLRTQQITHIFEKWAWFVADNCMCVCVFFKGVFLAKLCCCGNINMFSILCDNIHFTSHSCNASATLLLTQFFLQIALFSYFIEMRWQLNRKMLCKYRLSSKACVALIS